MTRTLLAVALVAALGATAGADGEDPLVLFAAGRYVAAAELFEHRWTASGDAVDGVNAVVAWRTAGRYARAAALLARVRAAPRPPSGDAAATATELEQRLATLTATAKITGVPAAAIVHIDSDPAELVDGSLVLDVGEHDIEIEQEDCERFVQHVTAFPGAQLAMSYAPRCNRKGTLHVFLAGDVGAPFSVDGHAYAVAGHEADVALEPGAHRLDIAVGPRPVVARSVTVESGHTTAVRVRFPWRARSLGFVFAATSATRAGQVMNGTAGGITFGLWSRRFRATFDAGSMISDTPGLRPAGGLALGHPWIADTLAIHLTSRPLWTGKLGGFQLALDADPLALRFDEVRAVSYFGIRANETYEARVRTLSFAPIDLSADSDAIHVEITWWPISYAMYHEPASPGSVAVGNGVGTFLTILAGWRLVGK